MNKSSLLHCLGWGSAITIGAVASLADAPPARHLFLDPAFIDQAHAMELRVNPPIAEDIVIRPDQPWESMMNSLFLTARDEDGVVRIWYICRDREQNRPNVAYAESTDGVNFVKPDLGIVDFNGNTNNNLVGISNLEGTVVRDYQGDPDARYLYVSNVYHEGIFRFTSPDGLHWSRDPEPLLRFESDTQNVLLRDPTLNRWVMFLRGWIPGTDTERERRVLRLELDELSKPVPIHPSGRPTRYGSADPRRLPWIVDEIPVVMAVDERDPPDTDIYNISAQVYPPDPSWYIGFPALYHHRTESGDEHYENDGWVESQFAGSRDGVTWHRYDRRPYIGASRAGPVKMNYMGTGLVIRGDEIWTYGVRFRTSHGDGASRRIKADGDIMRYVQRLDGFVSLNATDTLGEARTQPVRVTGESLLINADVELSGELRLALLDELGAPLPGFGFDDALPIQSDGTSLIAGWDNGTNLSTLQGRQIRVGLRARHARVFSFRFE